MRLHRLLGWCAVPLWIAAAGAPAAAQQDYYKYNVYDTPKRPPFKLHDHVHVAVVERARGSSTTDLRTDQRSRWELNLDKWLRLNQRSGEQLKEFPRLTASELTGDPGIDIDSRFRTDNSGQTSRVFDLTFTITGVVKDIRPNGILIIEARKRRQVNGETEMIRLSGEVSPSSVGVNNVVASSDVANLDIEYDGEGTTGNQTRPGWFMQILGWIWPF